MKDQSGFYQIRGLGISINIKAFNWVYRLLRLLLLINQLLIKKAKKRFFLGGGVQKSQGYRATTRRQFPLPLGA